MATFALGTNLTLSELVRREDPDGTLADIVDVLSQTNDIIRDATWQECNNGTAHQATRAASEPSGTIRSYNAGVAPEAGVTEVVTEPTQMLDGLSIADEALLMHSPNGIASARIQEDGFFLRGLAKQFVSTLFDGNRSTTINQVNGINNRSDYNALSSDYTFDNAGGNSADNAINTSIYIIQWGPKRVNLIHPRNDPNGGTMFGIQMIDMGVELVNEAVLTTRQFRAYRTYFKIHFGIFISDPRMIKRIVNIGTSGINGTSVFSFNEDLLIEAVTELEDGGIGAVIYVNKTVMAQMWKRANEKGNAMYTMTSEGEGPFARPVVLFNGIPVHRVDQITNAQADVT